MTKLSLTAATLGTLALVAFALQAKDNTEQIVLKADAPFAYSCKDGKNVTAQYFHDNASGISVVKLTLDAGIRFLPQAVSADGGRYTDGRDIEWWDKGEEAMLNYDTTSDDPARQTTCKLTK